ncbi:MAG TPA: DUF4259 domain-containing protein [Candidatus Dormibacteraeota bacterium]|nr:DUF4259 domain-containing protein [Candidatus Dormibacteraeota bacterium]
MLAFDNDEANDWAYGLEDADDLAPVQAALAGVDTAGADDLDADAATEALAACEVLARLRGRPGYKNAYTEKVDDWVASHPIDPDAHVIEQAGRAIDRILGDNSELRELWDDSGDAEEWRAAVADLRNRVVG